MATNAFAERYDDIIRHPRMVAHYGESGYFNVGYWVDGIDDQARACQRLVDEVATGIGPDARLILDVGCGVGAGTRRLAQLFPQARVMGCNISAWQLAQARERGVEWVIETDASNIALESGTADAVVALESAQHFATRETFLREAHRLLRPGGSIVLADMLFADREPVGSWMLPPENYVEDPSAYADLLEEAGFADVEVRDVTERTWLPHSAMMRLTSPEHADQIDRIERSLSHYVLAFGRRG